MENGGWMKPNPDAGPSSVLNPPSSPFMPDPVSNPELLRSLGRLVRGLSALFWGLPASLIICAGTATGGWFNMFGELGFLPATAATGLLLFGLYQLGAF